MMLAWHFGLALCHDLLHHHGAPARQLVVHVAGDDAECVGCLIDQAGHQPMAVSTSWEAPQAVFGAIPCPETVRGSTAVQLATARGPPLS